MKGSEAVLQIRGPPSPQKFNQTTPFASMASKFGLVLPHAKASHLRTFMTQCLT